jgi:D-alanyl-D-alanine carboxypeptidase
MTARVVSRRDRRVTTKTGTSTNIGPGYAHGYAVGFGDTPRTYTDISGLPIGGWGGIEGGYGLGLFRIDSPCGTVWGHGGDPLGHHSTAVTSADGRRTAVSDTTVEPSDTKPNDGVNRYYEVAFAAENVTICQMLDKPVPAAVTQALHGTTPTCTAAK